MATFLQLAQMVARESGTMAGVTPTTVVGQVGRAAKVVYWVQEAWTRIQVSRQGWKFLRKSFAKPTVIGQQTYSASSDWSLTDVGRWLHEVGDQLRNTTIYETAVGVSDESEIQYVDYDIFRRLYLRGTQTSDRPRHWTISPAGDVMVGPAPDKVYTIDGEYESSGQSLSLDADVPLCPARFHDVIAWRALILLSEHDEAPFPVLSAKQNYAELIAALERDQLPMLLIGSSPIA